MNHPPVVQMLSASLMVPDPPEVEAHLEYLTTDPYAVRLLFGARCTLGETPVVWVFARQLLAEGLVADAGHGDVRVRPHGPGQTAVELRSPTGCAVVTIETRGIRTFLTASHRAVPPGSEDLLIDWERVITGLLTPHP
ncbi:SsgA family sporulation/cell division regulator [Kitasatospora sp. NPDC101801]